MAYKYGNKGHSATELQEKATQPPEFFTETDLLSVMKNAGAHIENLFSRNYIIRKSKTLYPIDKGLKLYDLVKDKK